MSGHPLNHYVISQVLFDLRNGQLKSSIELGFSEEDIRLLKDPKKMSVLLNTSVRWVNAKVDPNVIHRLWNRIEDHDKEIYIIDEMLKLGASSKLISDVFGLDQREVAFRKRVLDIEKKQGRWPEITEEQSHQLWHEWKTKIDQYHLDIHNLMDMAKVCMVLARKHDIPMAMIWQAIEQWIVVMDAS